MRITFINPHSLKNWGGNEKWVVRMSELLMKKGVEVEIIALNHTPKNIARVNEDFLKAKLKVDYNELETRGGKYIPIRANHFPNIDTDFIYTTVPYYGFLDQISRLKVPKVWGFHDPSLQNPSNILQKRLISHLLPRFDLIHLLSDAQLELIPKTTKSRVLETTWMYDFPQCEKKFDAFTVIFFGRHETDKGIDTLLNMKSKFGSEIRFLVAGNGPRTKDIQEKFSKDEILGFVNDNVLMDNVHKSHATLFSSHSESTTSLVAMESLANCTPLIYRNMPVNRNLSKYPLNIGCSNDNDFENGVKKMKKLYESNREDYLEECKKIQTKMVSSKEYIDKFLNEIVKPVINDNK